MSPRIVILLLVAPVVAVAVTMVTASLLQASSRPSAAVRLWPWNSIALANRAGDMALADAGSNRLSVAATDAGRALSIEPGNPVAARAIGMVAGLQGKNAEAVRALRYSEAMSRRDLATQMALIELRVQQNDIPGALLHYDRALRTTRSVPILLSTMIAAAGGDAQIRRAVLDLVATRPPWRSAFMVQLLDEPTPADTVFAFIARAGLDPRRAYDRDMLARAVGKLVGQGHVDQARRLIGPSGSGVRNGDFESENRFPPLDWALVDEANLSAVIENDTGTGRAGRVLYVDARNDRGGDVGYQLLSLAAGRYRLALRSGNIVSAGSVRIAMTCGPDQGGDSLLAFDLPVSTRGAPAPAGSVVTVPVGCRSQRLTISVPRTLDSGNDRPWIDDVSFRPANGS